VEYGVESLFGLNLNRTIMQVPPTGHDPVLLNEILEWCSPHDGQLVVDATVGRGGHSLALAKAIAPHGTLIGMDYDPRNLAYARDRLAKSDLTTQVRLFHANFSELIEVLRQANHPRVDLILADLGVSTNQLFEQEYGLSFSNPVPLDMRLDPRNPLTARTIVNTWSEQKLATVLYELADERFSRRIAKKIVEARKRSPINTTDELADLVRSVVPVPRGSDRSIPIDPATRTFLALRMVVNGEMENLEKLLRVAPDHLKPGGKIAIISFHSTEDRLVKHVFRSAEQTGQLKVLTSKPIVPSETEIQANPRSRSAKLRVAERL
jgi:16S rRNA (cytosine1402-N4)-methyltransferase